jgi:hypothetical protein
MWKGDLALSLQDLSTAALAQSHAAVLSTGEFGLTPNGHVKLREWAGRVNLELEMMIAWKLQVACQILLLGCATQVKISTLPKDRHDGFSSSRVVSCA